MFLPRSNRLPPVTFPSMTATRLLGNVRQSGGQARAPSPWRSRQRNGARIPRRFDPEKFLIVVFEQRGCGRSRPLVTDLARPTWRRTPHKRSSPTSRRCAIIFGVAKLASHGISWGTTLALAYAQAHSERVSEIILAAVATTSAAEVEWVTRRSGGSFPREWEEFPPRPPPKTGQRLIDAYYERIANPDPAVRAERLAPGAPGKTFMCRSIQITSTIRATTILCFARCSQGLVGPLLETCRIRRQRGCSVEWTGLLISRRAHSRATGRELAVGDCLEIP